MADEAVQIETIAHDVLRGCTAIGIFTGKTPREVRFAIETGRLPAWREGVTWCASKAALRRHYAEKAATPITPEQLRAERAAKAAVRRKRDPSLPKVSMERRPRGRKRQLIGEVPGAEG
jgi:hypothetical protein